jgi:hypothetical protein
MNPRCLPAILLLAAALACAPRLAADDVERSTAFGVEGAYYLPNQYGYDRATGGLVGDGGFAPILYGVYPEDPAPGERSLGSTWGPAKIQVLLRHRIEIPVLAGQGALTADNNLRLSFLAALTPVSARLETESTLTPIAFLNLFAGAMVGTGWNIGLFDGLGLNTAASPQPDDTSFEGVVLNPWIGATFQFDLAALVPGDWTHVVTLLRPTFHYWWFSGAGRGEAWMWEADEGENFNGWKLLGSYFVGYQMPLALDTVGVLLETEQHLGYVARLSPAGSGGWGSDFVRLTVSGVTNFTLSERSSLAVLLQFQRERLYSSGTILQSFYANRSYVGAYWYLWRVAFSYTLEL